ncbi:MAG: hypothetical protein Q4C91_21975 [Eubacteriales bacterium]|nr:hypothetical protein [Eubacteriales bacterium]
MKSLRERFEEEYAAVSIPADNKRGFRVIYRYYAPWYIWDLPEKQLSARKNHLLIISVSGLLPYLAAGLQDTDINRMTVPVIFNIIALCAYILELFAVFRFRSAKYKTDRTTYQSVDRTMRSIPLIRACCLLMTDITGICSRNFSIPDVSAAAALLGNLICAVLAFYIFYDYRKIPFRTEKNRLLQEDQKLL